MTFDFQVQPVVVLFSLCFALKRESCYYDPNAQSYRMHLKSSNGAIDVLVCPEEEAQCLEPPHSPISTANGLCAVARSVYSVLDSPELVPNSSCSQQQRHQDHQCALSIAPDNHRQEQAMRLTAEQIPTASSYPQVTVTGPSNQLDISLSSAAEVTGDDLGFMDRLLPLDMAMFDQLSPTLQTEDFSFSMDNSTEGINDLFDI